MKSNEKYNFEYDNKGNLVKKTATDGSVIWEYQYDLLNRLESVMKNGVQVASYIYDESGLRLKKTGTNATVYNVFDIGENVLYEQENRDYLEYVYVLGKHSITGELEKAAKFTGKDLDEDIGLYYFNARWYDQEIGRFISEDPIQDGENWYTYANNNPLIFFDRTYKNFEEARLDIFWYIESFYNRQRRHQALGYIAPVAFLKKYYQMK
ncbi:MAG: IS3 family transposase [Firmicutes bacterium]|mgnify:CR=1 FL=1|nr:IS3 family transposase [Bacillota bacterium]